MNRTPAKHIVYNLFFKTSFTQENSVGLLCWWVREERENAPFPFKHLFAPRPKSQMSNIFRDSESLEEK